MKLKSLLPVLLAGLIVTGPVTGFPSTAMAGSPQGKATVQAQSLSARQRAIIAIAAHTADGDLARLKPALAKGLEAGLAVNEIKEILVQLYAYTGFPRSLNAIHTFMALMDERQKAGIKDEMGREASPMPKDLDRDQYGATTRATLGGKDTVPPPAGYQLFAPAIDSFLKEHLFADIFYRDNLDWQSREIATISALAAMTGTAGQQRFHMGAAMNTGLDEAQMRAFIELVRSEVGEALANVSSNVFKEILAKRK